jgi:hypothetical protein
MFKGFVKKKLMSIKVRTCHSVLTVEQIEKFREASRAIERSFASPIVPEKTLFELLSSGDKSEFSIADALKNGNNNFENVYDKGEDMDY